MIDFLTTNWLWFLAIVALVTMHRRGHGCGMHGTHSQHDRTQADHQGQQR